MKDQNRINLLYAKKNVSVLIWAIAYLYIVLPIFIFFVGWIKWYFAVPICCLLVYSFYQFIKSTPRLWLPQLNRRNIELIIFIFVIICIWVYMSGIGGMVFQNKDHQYRNGIFRLLVEQRWPVIDINSNRGLIYYIAFWLPSAVIGKIFGITVGTRFQAIWAVLGLCIVYLFICTWRKKLSLWPLMLIIFFSGLDYFGVLTMGGDGIKLGSDISIEFWASGLYQYSSMTTLLFWVFNQALPCWVIITLIINQDNVKNLILLLALSMLSSTLPFVGLIPFVIYYLYKLRPMRSDTNSIEWRKYYHSILSFNNFIVGGIIGILSFLYLIGNTASNRIGGAATSAANLGVVDKSEVSRTAIFLLVIIFCLFEFGIYTIIIYKYQKSNPIFYIVVLCLLIMPFIKVGSGTDFCTRASIPALYFLMLMVIETLDKVVYKDKLVFIALVCALLIGAITPIHEMRRTIRKTAERCDTLSPILDKEIEGDVLMNSPNFSGDLDGNWFYKIFAK